MEVGRLEDGRWGRWAGGKVVGDGVGRPAMILVVGGRWWEVGDGEGGREGERLWKLGVGGLGLEVGDLLRADGEGGREGERSWKLEIGG